MSSVRPPILRRYIEATFGGRGPDRDAVAGATFDEWFALLRMVSPKVTAHRAALNAPTEELRAYAARFPKERDVEPALKRFAEVGKRAAVDLATAPLEPGLQSLQLSRLKSIDGWEALRGLPLEDLSIVLCTNPRGAPLSPKMKLHELRINSSDEATVAFALSSFSVEELALTYKGTVFDLARLADQDRLTSLWVGASLVRGLEHLSDRRFSYLGLFDLEPDEATRRGFALLADRVESLSLDATRPFGPDLLPEMPSLRRLQVPGYEAYREAWIDYAVAHFPRIGCFFTTPTQPDDRTVSVEEIYRGIDILRIVARGKTKFEVSGDMTEEVMARDPSWDGSNGDLEDELRKVAKRAKRKLSWGSEADNLVAWAADVETCRWLIDQIVDGAGNETQGRKDAKARGRK
jgi:hypothetical protein